MDAGITIGLLKFNDTNLSLLINLNGVNYEKIWSRVFWNILVGTWWLW